MPPKKHMACIYGDLLPRIDTKLDGLTGVIQTHIEKQSLRDEKQFDLLAKHGSRIAVVETKVEVLKKNNNNPSGKQPNFLDSMFKLRKIYLAFILIGGAVGVNLVGVLLSQLGAWLQSVSVAIGG